MRQPNHIFKNPHPGIVVVLFMGTAGGTALFNFWALGHWPFASLASWTTPALVGIAAWFINVVLVYRSRYLKTNYLLGWYWFCLMLALHPQGITPDAVWASMGISVWLAMAYELSDERKDALFTRSNLGLFSAFLGVFSISWWSLLLPSLFALRTGTLRQPPRYFLQVAAGWFVGLASVFTFAAYTGNLATYVNEIAQVGSRPWSFQWLPVGYFALAFWMLFAVFETMRAMRSAKKAKRRGLIMSWIGIIWGVSLILWQGEHAQAGAILAVFAAPHIVNLQSYLTKAWMIRTLDASLVGAAILGLVMSHPL